MKAMLAFLTSGASAATAIVYLAHKGNTRANWFAICQQFNSFCERVSGSLVGSFIAILVLMLLIVLSAVALSRNWFGMVNFYVWANQDPDRVWIVCRIYFYSFMTHTFHSCISIVSVVGQVPDLPSVKEQFHYVLHLHCLIQPMIQKPR